MANQAKPGTIGAQAIEQRPVDALIPYARNARTHSEAQVSPLTIDGDLVVRL